MSDYSIGGSIHGGNPFNSFDDWAQELIKYHARIAYVLLIVFVIIILYLFFRSCSESFMPTQLMKYQQGDVGWSSYGTESLDDAGASGATDGQGSSYFAQMVQSTGGGQFTVNPSSAPGQPGSLSYQVLNSPSFNCGAIPDSGSHAYSWMRGQGGSSVAPVAVSTAAAPAAVSAPVAVVVPPATVAVAAPAASTSVASASETMLGGKIRTDNDFSRIMSGFH